MLLESWRLELLMYEPRASPLTDTLTTQCIAVVRITLTTNIDRSPKHSLVFVMKKHGGFCKVGADF
jgi:hypothetical protein